MKSLILWCMFVFGLNIYASELTLKLVKNNDTLTQENITQALKCRKQSLQNQLQRNRVLPKKQVAYERELDIRSQRIFASRQLWNSVTFGGPLCPALSAGTMLAFWCPNKKQEMEVPLRHYFTENGIFVVFNHGCLIGINLQGPIQMLPKNANCTNHDYFFRHLEKECNIMVIKVQVLSINKLLKSDN
jgi:hypothetical protein